MASRPARLLGGACCVSPPFQRPQLEGWLWGNWNSFGYFGFFNYGLGLDGFRIELEAPGKDGWYICGFNT